MGGLRGWENLRVLQKCLGTHTKNHKNREEEVSKNCKKIPYVKNGQPLTQKFIFEAFAPKTHFLSNSEVSLLLCFESRRALFKNKPNSNVAPWWSMWKDEKEHVHTCSSLNIQVSRIKNMVSKLCTLRVREVLYECFIFVWKLPALSVCFFLHCKIHVGHALMIMTVLFYSGITQNRLYIWSIF